MQVDWPGFMDNVLASRRELLASREKEVHLAVPLRRIGEKEDVSICACLCSEKIYPPLEMNFKRRCKRANNTIIYLPREPASVTQNLV